MSYYLNLTSVTCYMLNQKKAEKPKQKNVVECAYDSNTGQLQRFCHWANNAGEQKKINTKHGLQIIFYVTTSYEIFIPSFGNLTVNDWTVQFLIQVTSSIVLLGNSGSVSLLLLVLPECLAYLLNISIGWELGQSGRQFLPNKQFLVNLSS